MAGGIARTARKVLRTVLGEDSQTERKLRRKYTKWAQRSVEGTDSSSRRMARQATLTAQLKAKGRVSGRSFTMIRGSDPERRLGIYMKGSCDLPTVFACTDAIARVYDGTAAIVREGVVSDAHSRLLLQARNQLSAEWTGPVLDRLNISAEQFDHRFWDDDFTIREAPGFGSFPKSVVVLSAGADLTRTLYKHREHGFLIDPGSWWLNDEMDKVLQELPHMDWFQENFQRAGGKIRVEDFKKNYAEIIRHLQERGATVMMFNQLVVEPGSRTHSYQFMKKSQTQRRREFHLAMCELSQELDFDLVDVDRILKRQGVEEQVDFAHYPLEKVQVIADEIFAIIQRRGVLERA